MKILIKKHPVSNKDKTLGNNDAATALQSPPNANQGKGTPTPFIDRLYVVVKVPSIEDGSFIHSHIWAHLDDKETFIVAKNQGDYKFARRLHLPSVMDFKKRPYFQYAYTDGVATKLRVDFVPIDLGPQGLMELHAVLQSVVPNGWAYFIEHGQITRLNVAMDFASLNMVDFHFLPKQAATTTMWQVNGNLGTFQHGQGKSNHTSIYNREAKRKAQGKGWQGKTGIRVERRFKQGVGPLRDLGDLPDPFAAFKLVQRAPCPHRVKNRHTSGNSSCMQPKSRGSPPHWLCCPSKSEQYTASISPIMSSHGGTRN